MRLSSVVKFTMILIMVSAGTLAQERVGNRVKGQLLVQHRTGAQDAEASVRAHGGTVKTRIQSIKAMVLEVPESSIDNIKRALSKNGKFSVVEYNHVAEVVETPNDPRYGSQWHLPRVNLPAAWSLTTGSQAISIAVLDTGIDTSHEDLYAKIRPGQNYVTGLTGVHDVNGHGTAVAGTAAAATHNTVGVAGAGWDTPIVPMRVANSTGWATYSAIAAAIVDAADQGIRIISISISGTSSSAALQSAVSYAWNKGSVVFAAAGNANSSAPNYPAACTYAVAVASTNGSDTKSGFSNYGSWISLTAPGESILTTARYGGYSYWSGTSFSTPLTAGVAALVLSANPNLTASELVSTLEQNATDLGASGFDNLYGWGRVNAEKSVAAALNGGTTPPADDPPADEQPAEEPPADDTVAPKARITSPSNGSIVKKRATIRAKGTDNVGVTRLDLKINGTVVQSWTSSSLRYSWSPSKGTHTIEVIAHDAAGLTGSSSVRVSRTK